MHLKQVMDLQDGESVVSSEEHTVGITDPRTSSKYGGLIKHAGAFGQASYARQSQKKHNLKATIPEFKGLRKVSTIDSPAQPQANRTGRIDINQIGVSSAQQERQSIAVDLTKVSSTDREVGLPQAASSPDSQINMFAAAKASHSHEEKIDLASTHSKSFLDFDIESHREQ